MLFRVLSELQLCEHNSLLWPFNLIEDFDLICFFAIHHIDFYKIDAWPALAGSSQLEDTEIKHKCRLGE